MIRILILLLITSSFSALGQDTEVTLECNGPESSCTVHNHTATIENPNNKPYKPNTTWNAPGWTNENPNIIDGKDESKGLSNERVDYRNVITLYNNCKSLYGKERTKEEASKVLLTYNNAASKYNNKYNSAHDFTILKNCKCSEDGDASVIQTAEIKETDAEKFDRIASGFTAAANRVEESNQRVASIAQQIGESKKLEQFEDKSAQANQGINQKTDAMMDDAFGYDPPEYNTIDGIEHKLSDEKKKELKQLLSKSKTEKVESKDFDSETLLGQSTIEQEYDNTPSNYTYKTSATEFEIFDENGMQIIGDAKSISQEHISNEITNLMVEAVKTYFKYQSTNDKVEEAEDVIDHFQNDVEEIYDIFNDDELDTKEKIDMIEAKWENWFSVEGWLK